jgi:hypothetical protein
MKESVQIENLLIALLKKKREGTAFIWLITKVFSRV